MIFDGNGVFIHCLGDLWNLFMEPFHLFLCLFIYSFFLFCKKDQFSRFSSTLQSHSFLRNHSSETWLNKKKSSFSSWWAHLQNLHSSVDGICFFQLPFVLFGLFLNSTKLETLVGLCAWLFSSALSVWLVGVDKGNWNGMEWLAQKESWSSGN